ncbi:hypothetical protein [Pseudotabrizicola formosa]|uniref:hypothetical protein n=1 Tax=Pseudotabrizicola formosa TaxID=2030009 RepID=UPI00143D6891|nr:hypothetical protein [Pseudotabrizicola formosa]
MAQLLTGYAKIACQAFFCKGIFCKFSAMMAVLRASCSATCGFPGPQNGIGVKDVWHDGKKPGPQSSTRREFIDIGERFCQRLLRQIVGIGGDAAWRP